MRIWTLTAIAILLIVIGTAHRGCKRSAQAVKPQEATKRAAQEQAQRDRQNRLSWANVAAYAKRPISPHAFPKIVPPTVVESSESTQGRLVAAFVSIDGTNEWSPENPDNWYHQTGLELKPGEKLWVQVLNPEIRLGYSLPQGNDVSTTIWGINRVIRSEFDGGLKDPKFGWESFGALFVVFLPELKASAQPITAASFPNNIPVVVGQNPSDKPVHVVLHRNLWKRCQSIVTGGILNSCYQFSGLSNPHGPGGEVHQKGLDRWLVRLRIIQEPSADESATPRQISPPARSPAPVVPEIVPSPDLRRQPEERPSPFPEKRPPFKN